MSLLVSPGFLLGEQLPRLCCHVSHWMQEGRDEKVTHEGFSARFGRCFSSPNCSLGSSPPPPLPCPASASELEILEFSRSAPARDGSECWVLSREAVDLWKCPRPGWTLDPPEALGGVPAHPRGLELDDLHGPQPSPFHDFENPGCTFGFLLTFSVEGSLQERFLPRKDNICILHLFYFIISKESLRLGNTSKIINQPSTSPILPVFLHPSLLLNNP